MIKIRLILDVLFSICIFFVVFDQIDIKFNTHDIFHSNVANIVSKPFNRIESNQIECKSFQNVQFNIAQSDIK